MSELEVRDCPLCGAPISGPGTCAFCGAAVQAKGKGAVNIGPWTTQAKAALEAGQKIEAIKIVREHTKLGLKQAKEIVEGGHLDAIEKTGRIPDGLSDSRPSGGCFPGRTRVATLNGERPIHGILPGDRVLTFDAEARTFVERPVTKVERHGPTAIVEVDLEGWPEPLRATAGHTVLTTKGWKRLADLAVGDELLGLDLATPRAVRRIARAAEPEPVFNIHTAWEHTFVADGFVAHNFTSFRRTRTAWHRLALDPTKGWELIWES